MPQKKRRTKKTKGGRRRKWSPQVSNSSTLSGPRISPDELDTRLMFRKIGQFNSVATSLGVAEFTPNAAYDVDPSLGSTETYGFDEYAALYSYYRVVTYSYIVTVTNSGNSPLMAYVVNSNTQPSVSGTRWDLYTTNPYCKSKLLAPVTGNPTTVTFRGTISCGKLLGSRAVETDDNYRALTTANPADLLWLGIAGESIATAVGVVFTYDLRLTMHVRFYSRELDLTLASLAQRINARLAAREELELRKKILAKKKE